MVISQESSESDIMCYNEQTTAQSCRSWCYALNENEIYFVEHTNKRREMSLSTFISDGRCIAVKSILCSAFIDLSAFDWTGLSFRLLVRTEWTRWTVCVCAANSKKRLEKQKRSRSAFVIFCRYFFFLPADWWLDLLRTRKKRRLFLHRFLLSVVEQNLYRNWYLTNTM